MYTHHNDPTTNGQIVRFRPIEGVDNDPELQAFFVVSEMKGDRVLITAIDTGMNFPPSQTVKTSDLFVYPNIRESVFSIAADNAPEYKGYHDPIDEWNGWANPMFEKEVAALVAEDTNKMNDEFGFECNDRFEWRGEILVQLLEDHSEYELKPEKVYVNGEGIKTLYAIGNNSWCWWSEDEALQIPLVDRLAKNFAAVLSRWLSNEEMMKVIQTNEAGDPTCCASHDFCDANMAMDEAFKRVIGRSPILPCDAEGNPELLKQEDAELDLWNKAWSMAKENKFYTTH